MTTTRAVMHMLEEAIEVGNEYGHETTVDDLMAILDEASEQEGFEEDSAA